MTLETLFSPETVAVIGASSAPSKVGHAVLHNLIEGGFEGTIVPVNPKAETLLGIRCYPDIGAYDGTVDLAVVCVPKRFVLPSVEAAIAKGASSVIVITAGFKETDEEGAALEQQVAEACRAKGVRMLGPNCVGLINTEFKMNASFAPQMPETGHISVLSQSGALCTSILDWALGRHLGLAKLVSLGNKADLDEIAFLRALADDPQTKVIVGYLESIESGDKFVKAAEAVAAKKPVVILKAGTSVAGGRAASSHTGSLAGADIAYSAAFARAGIIRATAFEELLDNATALSMQPLPRGDRVAIITNAGGPGIMAADAVEHAGMQVAQLDHATATALRKKLPFAASVGNPIDVLGDADPERYAAAMQAAQEDDGVDAVIALLAPQAMTSPAETARAIAGSISGDKPVLAAFLGGREVIPGRDELVSFGLPDFPSPERAVAALKAMVDYAAWRNRPPRVVKRFPVNRRRVERILHRHARTGLPRIAEADAKEILRAYDFNVPPGKVVTDAEQAVEAATRMGYPVAMKINSPDIVHKSDLGGVKLGLATPDAVRDAYELMMLRIGRRAPEARLRGVYLEQMAARGQEVILGMSRDPQFGPMLMFGLGGIFVEVMKDVTFHLAPITADEALQMLMGTRSYALLSGARGRDKVDLEAVAACLQRISQLATDFPQIEELDINPLIVGGVGTDPVVADARIGLRKTEVSDD